MRDRDRFPLDEWKIVEREYCADDAGRTETMFALGNGYLGLRGNHPDEAVGYEHGTFINGFHETWPIRHAENAFGLAQVGQTIINVPDAKPMQLEIAGELFSLDTSEFRDYTRTLDMRTGLQSRTVEWTTTAGARVRIDTGRIVSFVDRRLAVQRIRVTLLEHEGDAGEPLPVEVVSRLVNRQDQPDAGAAELFDPRRAGRMEGRILNPEPWDFGPLRNGLMHRTTASGLAVGVVTQHVVTGNAEVFASSDGDNAMSHIVGEFRVGETLEVVKYTAYQDGADTEIASIAAQCNDSLDRATALGWAGVCDEQRDWLEDFWQRSDVTVHEQPEVQQAVRWSLLQVAQSSARADGRGVAAKGVSGSGYGGHYFWDTEVYVLPFLTYTSPQAARNALQMRVNMLPAARLRAADLSESGALYPWRTITGEEASAYYPAGTAQYHIDADICFAIAKYVRATGDIDFLASGGIDVVVETARMWLTLGFWGEGTEPEFHIHGVTGPDEYTTVVNDNFYTNVMARANLEYASAALAELAEVDPEGYRDAVARLEIREDEPGRWRVTGESMYIGYDEERGIHPQDAQFLEKEVWDFEGTPSEKYPLLLHFHPLVIYRHQVLKQADVVLALFLQSDHFTAEEKRADFEYYDPLTTGDSTLSGVVQAIMAAEVGYEALALEHFSEAIKVDLDDLHGNSADGVHVASAGGVWSALVYGFAGMRDAGGAISFDPRLPAEWPALSFALTRDNAVTRVTVRQDSLTVETDGVLQFSVRGRAYEAVAGTPTVVPLEGQGDRFAGHPKRRVV